MHNNAAMKFSLLKKSINTPQYQKSITETLDAQNEFISTLQTNQYTHYEILELIHMAQDKLVRSLLITHLLSMEEYVKSLMGNSILNRLGSHEFHIPSRLNPLIHQMDISHLTLEQIKRIQPEAAISILCSIPHFHLLNKDQINELIGQYPYPAVIQYWINHFALMPNAYYTLAHLSKLVDTHVLNEVHQLSQDKKTAIINSILEHLDLYNPLFKLLHEDELEHQLKTAINHYLNGNQHQNYVIYIKLLTRKLFLEQTLLSLDTIQLLISLNDNKEFSEITKKTSYLINYYLRFKAQSGDTQLFYNEGKLNIHVMTQLVQLIPSLPPKEEETRRLLKWIQPTEQQQPQSIVEQNPIPENSLIPLLAQKEKSVRAFDYFLLHFKGNTRNLSKTIKNYLEYHVQEGCSESRRKTIYHTAILMNRPEVKNSVREAIYTSLLHYPELYDESISCWLLRYDAKRTLQHFGLKGGAPNYILIMELCTDALKKLDPTKDKHIIQIANQAYAEARQELSFSEEKGFFTWLIQRIKRCWINGWTGFFSPNLPVYVAPSYTKPIVTDRELSVLEPESKPTIKDSEQKLARILKNIEKHCTIQNIDELIDIMTTNSFKANAQEELNLRTRINLLFHELILDSKQNKGINSWLAKNHHILNVNRFRLLELIFTHGSREDLELFINQVNDDSTYLPPARVTTQIQSIVSEFKVVLPELNDEIELPPQKGAAAASELLSMDTMSNLFNNAWSWTKGNVGVFFANNSALPPPAETPPQTPLNPNTLH